MRLFFIVSLTLIFFCCKAEVNSNKTCTVYLFHGQGSDSRIFQDLNLGVEYRTIPLQLPVPDKGITMSQYAQTFVEQIDTTSPYGFIGVSMGGMVCTELATMLHPEFTIIISSAKNRNELPFRYKFMKYLPLYKIIPARMIKAGSFIAQPLFEPDRKNNKETFVAMLHKKNPKFLKRSTGMIVNWEPSSTPEIIHIHGTKDHTLPYRRIDADYTVVKGSHMMTLTKAELLNGILLDILNSN